MTPRSSSAERREARHVRRGEAHHVERADEIDGDHPRKFFQRHRPGLTDHPFRDSDTRGANDDPRRP
jgi:hypothetical protein